MSLLNSIFRAVGRQLRRLQLSFIKNYVVRRRAVQHLNHSLANRHSCLTPAKNEGIDIDNAGPTAGGMISQQTIFVYP